MFGAVTYQDATVKGFLASNFVLWRVEYLKQTELVDRFRVEWTPWIAIIDEHATDHHHDVGLLEPDQFLGQIKLGLARMAYHQGEFGKAAGLFNLTCQDHPQSAAAPEAIWYRGVATFRTFGDPAVLGATRRELHERYPQNVWAQKAGAWGA